MKNPICIKCGRAAWRNSLCREHFAGGRKLLDVRNISAVACRKCGSIYYGKWFRKPEEAIFKMGEKMVSANAEAQIIFRTQGNRIHTRLTAVSKAGVKKPEEQSFTVTLKRGLCADCVKVSGGYYEAVFQIRGTNAERILETVMKSVEERKVVGIQNVKNGYDVRVLTKDIGKRVSRTLAHYKIKKSYKHVTTKKGRMIYRDFYSVR